MNENMNREEKLEEFANGYASFYVDDNYEAVKAGVDWADSNPREGLVDIEDVIDFIFRNTAYFDSIDNANDFIDNLRKQFKK